MLILKIYQPKGEGPRMVPAHKGNRVKGQGSKHNNWKQKTIAILAINMLSRLFLRRYSLRSRARSLPLRGDVDNVPGSVSFDAYFTLWCALFRVTTTFFTQTHTHDYTRTEYAFPDKEQSTTIPRSSRGSFIRILFAFHCHLVPAEEEGHIAVSLSPCCH